MDVTAGDRSFDWTEDSIDATESAASASQPGPSQPLKQAQSTNQSGKIIII